MFLIRDESWHVGSMEERATRTRGAFDVGEIIVTLDREQNGRPLL